MADAYLHIESIDPQDAAFARVLGGVGEIMNAARDKFVRCAEEKQQAQHSLFGGFDNGIHDRVPEAAFFEGFDCFDCCPSCGTSLLPLTFA